MKSYKKFVGAHVSISGGISQAPLNAAQIGARAFALFTKNQRQWVAPHLSEEEISKFKINCKASEIDSDYILPHDSYLINLGSPSLEDRKKSLKAFVNEVVRVEKMGLKLLNFHPGSHKNLESEDQCIHHIAESLNQAIDETEHVILVIENTAGQGGNVGYRFEQIRDIIDLVKNKKRVGVCFDTAHAFAAGYELRDLENYKKTFDLFGQIIGFKYLKGMHINDSKAPFGSRKDRHHSLGMGEIGWDLFKNIMRDERFNNIPLILETIDENLWTEEIKKLYSFIS